MIGDNGWPLQFGFVVSDIAAAIEHWRVTAGAGPFVHVAGIDDNICLYRGEPTSVVLDVALAYCGDTQIELIRQVNDAPSPYRAFLASGGTGVQHFGFWSSDVPAACARLESEGYAREFVCRHPSARHGSIYFDAPGGNGPMIEISEATPGKLATYNRLRDLCNAPGRDLSTLRFDTFAGFVAQFG